LDNCDSRTLVIAACMERGGTASVFG